MPYLLLQRENQANRRFLYYRLADVAGTPEPIYGPSALQSVAEQTNNTPYTELKADGFKWKTLNSTNVETQVFYMFAKTGHAAFVQIIYSNVAYVSILYRSSLLVMKANMR